MIEKKDSCLIQGKGLGGVIEDKNLKRYDWSDDNVRANFKDLVGKTVVGIRYGCVYDTAVGAFMEFKIDDGSYYRSYVEHTDFQCAGIKDVCGEPADLMGEITIAEEWMKDIMEADFVSDLPDEMRMTHDPNLIHSTRTFFEIATNKGAVTVTWEGETSDRSSLNVGTYYYPSKPTP